jgi:hypothetical protein
LGLLLAADLGGAHVPEQLDSAARKSEPVQRLSRDVVKSLAIAPTSPRFIPDNPAIFSPLPRFTNRWFMLLILAIAHHCASVGENAESISISGRRHIERHPTEQTETLVMDQSVWVRRQAA